MTDSTASVCLTEDVSERWQVAELEDTISQGCSIIDDERDIGCSSECSSEEFFSVSEGSDFEEPGGEMDSKLQDDETDQTEMPPEVTPFTSGNDNVMDDDGDDGDDDHGDDGNDDDGDNVMDDDGDDGDDDGDGGDDDYLADGCRREHDCDIEEDNYPCDDSDEMDGQSSEEDALQDVETANLDQQWTFDEVVEESSAQSLPEGRPQSVALSPPLAQPLEYTNASQMQDEYLDTTGPMPTPFESSMPAWKEESGEQEEQMEDVRETDQRHSEINQGEDDNIQDSQVEQQDLEILALEGEKLLPQEHPASQGFPQHHRQPETHTQSVPPPSQYDQVTEQPSLQYQTQQHCSADKTETYQEMADSDTQHQMLHHQDEHQPWQPQQLEHHQQQEQQQFSQYPPQSIQGDQPSPYYNQWFQYQQFGQPQSTFPQPYNMPWGYDSNQAAYQQQQQQQHTSPGYGSSYAYPQTQEEWQSRQDVIGTGVQPNTSAGQVTKHQDKLEQGKPRPPTPPDSEVRHDQAKVQDETSDPGEMPSSAIEVTGFANNTDTDVLEMYFENKKRSGGGPIQHMDKKDENTVIITFEDKKAAEGVLSRAKHVIDGVTLTVKEVQVLPRDTQSFVLNGVPHGTVKDDLQMYLENCTKMSCEPELFFGEKDSAVIVKYPEEIKGEDFETIVKRVSTKPFMGAKLTINPINRTNCILVRDLPSGISSHYIQLYFENRKRSGGGDVVEVNMETDGMSAFVFFQDYRVVDSVLTQKHQIDNEQVDVQPYHECTGFIISREEALPDLPGPTSVQVDAKVINFVRSDNCRMQQLANEVAVVHGRLEITDDAITDHVTVQPTFSAQTPGVHKLVKTWAKDVAEKVCGHLKQYKAVSIHVSDGIWLALKSKLCERKDLNPDLDEDAKLVVFTSTVEEANQFENALQMMIRNIEEDLEMQRQIRSETVPLKEMQVKQLDVVNFSETVEARYPDVKIVVSETDSHVTFDGIYAQLLEAKCFMLETLHQFHTTEIKPNSASLSDFLTSEDVCNEIYKMIREKNLEITFTAERGVLTCSALNRDEVKRGMQAIQNSVTEFNIGIRPQSENALKQDGWSALLEKLQRENVARIVVTTKEGGPRVRITALQETVPRIESALKHFIQLHTIVEKSVDTESGKLRFVSKFKSACLEQLKNGKLQPVQVTVKMAGRSGSITIKGTEDDINEAALCVTKLLDEILCRQFTVDKPGMPKLFCMERGKTYIQSIQNQYACLIEVNDPSEDMPTEKTEVTFSTNTQDESRGEQPVYEVSEEEDEHEMEASPEVTTTYRQPSSTHFITDEGKTIRLVKGNIANQTADVIVNTVQTTCNLKDAVISQAILREAGQQLQEDIDTKKHSVNEGDVIVTGSGNLTCRAVYHACILGTSWKGGFEAEPRLRHVLRTCLDYAHRGRMTSIAIPAIGTGKLGYPKNTTARIFYEEVKFFSKKHPTGSVSDIQVVVYDKDIPTCKAFEDEMINLYGTADERFQHEPAYAQDVPPMMHHSFLSRFAKTFGSSSRVDQHWQDSQVSPSVLSTGNVYRTAEGKTVKLVKGNLVTEQVDAIVNTIQTSCSLNNGIISQTILKAAGQQLQTEINQNKPKAVKEGDMIATGGANLKCKKVYHLCVLGTHWDGGTICIPLIRGVIKKCLDAADGDKISSIAIPAIGTGALKYPSNTVAKIMYEESIKFSASNPKSSVTDIRFVVYDQNLSACKAFEDEMKKLPVLPSLSMKTPKPATLTLPSAESSTTIKAKKRHGKESKKSPFRNLQEDRNQMMIGEICVQVIQGDITKETTDAIVNSSNPDLDLNRGGGVQTAILRAGGDAVDTACKNYVKQNGQVKSGSVARTNPGKLQCKGIVHIVMEPGNFESAFLAMLKFADSQRMTSLSMPLLGTGAHKLKPKHASLTILQTIGKFTAECKPSSLRLIRVVIFQAEMVGDFQQTFQDVLEKPMKSDASFFKKLAKKAHRKIMGETLVGSNINKPFHTLVFTVYGEVKTDVENAIKSIENIVKEESAESVIEKDIIKKISIEQMDGILQCAKSLDVEVEHSKRGGKATLTLRGLVQDVMHVGTKIHGVLEDIKTDMQAEAHRNLLAKDVTWKYEDSGQFEKYDENVNGIIEMAFNKRKPNVVFDVDGQKYRIDFKNMEERCVDDLSVPPARVSRELKEGGIKLPDKWGKMADNMPVKRVTLDPKSDEYKKVEKRMTQSYRPTSIIQIERIQNPKLYRQYSVEKQSMDAKNKPELQNEKKLFHGTAEESIKKINATGFNRSFAGTHAAVHGNGTYFAVNASYSAGSTYSKPDSKGYKYIYLAKVLTGEFTRGKRGLLVPPAKGSDPTDCYDSVVDNTTTPSMYIVFNDAMAYPEYLITFN